MKVILKYVSMFELQGRFSFVKALNKNMIDNMTPLQYLSKHSPSSYTRYARFGRLIKKNADVFALLQALSESRENDKELGILYLDSEVLHAI